MINHLSLHTLIISKGRDSMHFGMFETWLPELQTKMWTVGLGALNDASISICFEYDSVCAVVKVVKYHIIQSSD